MAKLNSKPSICIPAMLYLILSIIGLISMAYTQCMTVCILVNLLFIGIWTWFLNFLCKSGYTTISWILVILPFIMFILMILIVIELMRMNKVKENFSSSQQQCNSFCSQAVDEKSCVTRCMLSPELRGAFMNHIANNM